MHLELACLLYGSKPYKVPSNEITPLPLEFDFEHPEECARMIFAIMSNASGGFTMRDCKLRYDVEDKMANLTAHGCHVFYAVKGRPKIAVEEALARDDHSVTILLGDVATDQYGGGWQRARWSPVT